MLELRNRTPFVVGLFPGLDKEGYDDATVVVKGTFGLGRRERVPRVADEQVALVHGDEFYGEPTSSSIRYESDTSPRKLGTDLVLVGHAYSGKRAAASVDVSLSAGPLQKTVRVFGDRAWKRGPSGWVSSAPRPFERMPLVYERAYGGSDTSDPDPARHACERRNPVGVGFRAESRTAHPDEMALPNLEDPRNLIGSPGHAPAPAGFGFVGRSWMPRLSYVGTYDERWRRDRCPLLPADFDERYHSAAHPDLIAEVLFRGGEQVVVTNATEEGELRFELPARAPRVSARIRGASDEHAAVLDTVLLEPDAARLVCCWRATFRCPRSFLYIEHITIAEGPP